MTIHAAIFKGIREVLFIDMVVVNCPDRDSQIIVSILKVSDGSDALVTVYERSMLHRRKNLETIALDV